MSDLDDYRALLTRTRVKFREGIDDESPGVAFGAAERAGTILRVESDDEADDNVNIGYHCFCAILEFDADGKLARFGIWE